MCHLPYNSHPLPRSLATVCFIRWTSPNCLAWQNVSHWVSWHPTPTVCATVSQGYNVPAQSQRQLWPPISSNTEQSCFHSTSVKRGGSHHSVGFRMPFVPHFTLGTWQKGRGREAGGRAKHCTPWIRTVWVILRSCLRLESAGGVGTRRLGWWCCA